MSAKLVVLIETELSVGGTEDDPARLIREWHTPNGEFVAKRDDWQHGQDYAAILHGRLFKARETAAEQAIKELHEVLDDHLGKEKEPVGIRTRVLASALAAKKWLTAEQERLHRSKELKVRKQ